MYLKGFQFSLVAIVLVSNIELYTDAYSQGAPTRACVSMIPGHGPDKQDTEAPYMVQVTGPENDGKSVSLSIVALMDPFAGFMIQARDANNRQKIVEGTFSETDKQSQIKSCNSDKANTLTHRSASPRAKIQTVWTPPDRFTGTIVFRATIVQTKNVFWTEQDSPVVRFSSGKLVSDKSFLNAMEVNKDEKSIENSIRMSQKSAPNLSLNYSVCSEKLCLGLSSGTDCLSNQNCIVLLSGGYVNKDEGLAEFEINAISNNNQLKRWFSMAFSEDRRMDDDFVTDCFLTSDGKVKIGNSFNSGKSNHVKEELVKPISTSYSNSLVSCKWRTNRKTTINGKEFDLKDKKYYILLAFGNLEDDKGSKVRHLYTLASDSPIDLEQIGAISVKDSTFLVRIHGSLMVISWIGLVSIAILLARHYKQVWVSSTLCGVKIWFAFHRGFMVTSLVLMFVAQFCIFYYVGEYRVGGHQLFGSVAFIIAILQPIGALFRPAPDAPNRWIFNWVHWLGGNVGHITACVTIFLATNLRLASLPKPFLGTMISFVIFHVIIHVILQLHSFLMQKRNFPLMAETHDIALQDMSIRSSDDHQMGNDAPGTGFRRFILGVYCVCVSSFVIALIALISLPQTTLEKMAIT